MSSSSFRPLGLPIYVARVPTAPFASRQTLYPPPPAATARKADNTNHHLVVFGFVRWKHNRYAFRLGVLKRGLPFIIFLLVVLIAALAVHIDWTWKRKLSPRGGRYFFHRVELAVPSFRQSDEKWSDDPLGGIEANGTLGGEGCAVA